MRLPKTPRALIAAVLAIVMAVSILPVSVFAQVAVDAESLGEDVRLLSKTDYKVAPDIEETHFVLNNSDGTKQNMAYALTVKLGGSASLAASYKNQNGNTPGMQTVRDQAVAFNEKRNADGQTAVVAGVNADFYNMANGAPMGYLIMDGTTYFNNSNKESYFAILKDGTAVIRDGNVPVDDVKEAIGGNPIFVRDGKVVEEAFMTDEALFPRCVVGIKEDGSVVLLVVDGRQAPRSNGMTYQEVAQTMVALGCVTAMNMDGGGSATMISKHEGENQLFCRNHPSDGTERTVSTALLVTSNALPSGVFDHASLTPTNEVYTPGSTVDFDAIGVDSAGAPVDLPEDGKFELADNSFGTIDAATGVFVSGGKTGAVTVNYVAGGEVCGTVSVEIRDPDSISFLNDEISLGFEDTTDFNLIMKYEGRDVNYKDGDIVWSATNAVEGDPAFGTDCLAQIGTFNDNKLTTPDGTTITANVTATSVNNPKVKGTIKAIIGQLPTVVLDFEGSDYTIYNPNPNDAAEMAGGAGAAAANAAAAGANYYTSSYNRGGIPSAEIASIYDDYPVRFGAQSLKLNYDFATNPVTGTDGTCFGARVDFDVPGTPTKVGVWVYVPEGTGNFWLRAYVNSGEDKKLQPIDFTYEPKAYEDTEKAELYASMGLPAPGLCWTGWKYVEADLSTLPAPYSLQAGMIFRLMIVPGTGMGTLTKGAIYLDNMQFVYGANIDDTNEPVIDTMSVNTAEIKSGETTVNTNTVSLRTAFHDVENKYTSGLDVVRMYIDGKIVNDNPNYAEDLIDGKAEIYDLALADGVHSLKLSVRDKFGNETVETRTFTVNGGKEYPTIVAEPSTKTPLLGDKVAVALKSSDGKAYDKATIALRAGADFTDYTVTFADAYAAGSSYTYSAPTNTLTLKAVKAPDAESDGTIATVTYGIPGSLIEGFDFVYNAEGEFSAAAEDTHLPVFGTGDIALPVTAAYQISSGYLVVGQPAVVTVKDNDGNIASGVSVYKDDGTLLGVTDENGAVEIPAEYIVQGTIRLFAEKDGARSFNNSFNVFAVPASLADKLPKTILLTATGDSDSSKTVTWRSDPYATNDAAVLQIAEKTAYDKSKEAAFASVTGKTELLTFVNSKDIVKNNTVTVSDLKVDTAYVYRVGDGENWSAPYTFTLKDKQTDTAFFVIGDIQAEDLTPSGKIIDRVVGSGKYDFNIQTGDAVDNAGVYTTNVGEKKFGWDTLLDLYSVEHLGGIDTIHVLGNHEYEGNFSGENAAAIFNLDSGAMGAAYSVEYGNVYVATINYETDTADLLNALEWIKEDAKNSDAHWKVLTLHQPPYYTNASGGGNAPINQNVPPVVDEVGFDFVFSGHDHSYVRTQPMTGGEVDEENGAVYIISGTTGEKSYVSVENPAYNFAYTNFDFDAVYISVETTDKTFTVKTYNVTTDAEGNQTDELIDEYTMTRKVDCTESGDHDFTYTNGKFVCAVCGYKTDDYTGFVRDAATGKKMYAFGGTIAKDRWIPVGDDVYRAGADGYLLTGTQDVTEEVYGGRDEQSASYLQVFKKVMTLTYKFDDDGKLVEDAIYRDNNTPDKKANLPYSEYCIHAGRMIYDQWSQIDGKWYFFDGTRTEGGEVRLGKKLKGYVWRHDYKYVFDKTTGELLRGAWTEEINIRKTVGNNTDNYDKNLVIKGSKYLWAGQEVSGWLYTDKNDNRVFDASKAAKTRYLDPDNNNIVAVGETTIDGKIYIFDETTGVLIHEGAHNKQWVTTKAATCTAAGTRVQKCTLCGEVYATETVPALGHDEGTLVIVKAPTCTQPGVARRVCTRDNVVLGTEEVPATGHSFGEWKVVKAPTVDETGVEERICAIDGVKETRGIPKLDPEKPSETTQPAEPVETTAPAQPIETTAPAQTIVTEPRTTERNDEIRTVKVGVVGDLNQDGKINSADARLALRISARLDVPDAYRLVAADADGDRYIKSSDARLLLRYAARLLKNDEEPNIIGYDIVKVSIIRNGVTAVPDYLEYLTKASA
ncbi:MAG: phosphodiester glycosidase family protein [Clostridia bacterium]|nr:phosphodiester glycosidase family protein [Clostridia bacterium]